MSTHVSVWTHPPTDEQELISWFHRMREHAPVQEQPEQGWHVFGYAEAKNVLMNHAVFSNSYSAALIPEDSPFMLFRSGHLSWMDPPRLQQLRALVQSVFTPSYVASCEPMVHETIDEVLGLVASSEEVAYVEQIATPITSQVIAKVVGIPLEDVPLFGHWAAALMALTDPAATENGMPTLVEDTRQMQTYLHQYVAERRANPGEDLTSQLALAEIDGIRMPDAEMAGLIGLLMNTGVTSNQLLVNAMICFDRHPDIQARLRNDPGLLGSFIDEAVRFRGQTPRVHRFSLDSAAVGDFEIPMGKSVSVWLSAANRDPLRFPNPDVFDLDRSPNPHLGFGHGVHYCLGTALARLVAITTFEKLLEMSEELAVDYENTRLLDPRIVVGASELTLETRWKRSR